MQAAWNLESSCIPQIATPFGGGIARSGLVCGALAGSAMAIGLKLGPAHSKEHRDEAIYGAVGRIACGFRDRFGHTSCRDLTGIDVSTPAGRSKWETDGWQEKCAEFVAWAVAELHDALPPEEL